MIRATVLSRPIPATADVGVSISLMPGPPFGPSYLITATSPSVIRPCRIASTASSSDPKILAGPACVSISGKTADCFTTAPSGARLPHRTARPPLGAYGFAISLITSGFVFCALLMFSPIARLVTVIVPVLISPPLLSSASRAGIPPAK